MKKILLILVPLSLLLLSCIPESTSQGPRFTWSSFQRFWSKGATPLVSIDRATEVKEGYMVDYGHTTALTILLKKDIVTGVEITFAGGPENDAGGPQFLRLQHHAITVGTFRWPEEEVRKVREHFAVMGASLKEYRYQATLFERGYEEDKGWFFSFTYVEDKNNPAGRAALPK